MKYALLYMDADGSSHFKDVEIELDSVNFAPPAPPVELSEFIAASRFVFFKVPSGWFGDWHPAPKRQFFCCLTGEFELTTSDGEKRLFRQGDVFLLEDIKGKGHQSKVTSKEDFVAAVIQIAP